MAKGDHTEIVGTTMVLELAHPLDEQGVLFSGTWALHTDHAGYCTHGWLLYPHTPLGVPGDLARHHTH